MKTNIVDHAKTVLAGNESRTKPKWMALLLFLVFVALGAGGCTGYYSATPGYYGPAYGPGYAAYPGSITVEVGDRPYYNRGAGYYVGRTYYVWRPGHWGWRHGQRVWIHGHYVLR